MRRRAILEFAAAAATFSPATVCAQGANLTHDRVEIYYHDWDVRTRSDLSAEDVRRMYDACTIIRGTDEVERFASRLGLDALAPDESERRSRDLRLVIDFGNASGRVETFCCDNFRMYSMDWSRSRAIDSAFKNMFRIF